MRGSYVLAAAALTLSVFVGTALASRPCGRAVIEDWYDNGTIDRSWDCECLRDAIDRLPDIGAPYSSAQDDFQRQLERQQCEGTGQNVVEGTRTQSSGSGGSDKSIGVSDDSFPWEVAIVGGLALALAALVVVALQRQRRQRSD